MVKEIIYRDGDYSENLVKFEGDKESLNCLACVFLQITLNGFSTNKE